MTRLTAIAVVLLVMFGTSAARAQSVDEAKLLKQEIETLKAKLEAANLKIEKLAAENEQLKAGAPGAAPKAAPPADPFAKGAAWVGEFRLAIKDAPVQKWALIVTERSGSAFKGEIIGKNRDGDVETVKVTGTAPAKDTGAVTITTEWKGFGKATMRGKLTRGEVALVFSGTDKLGRNVAGTATLSPKN